ncbi:hypothetical protein [Nonomuraea rhodomycinica]|uniref:Ig-like domain-containing protein n=1 Tax=Nonomuraea rhodomycinica TaxID=1712872 RepID=A0A7Y6MEA8_9ACTN|nr:hypothetical protein [Nonomuraea rhodomycinica]NUW43501.1 hypothetical protein [Nonomuraea rhodomycinica]
MKSSPLARKAAAFGASATVLAGMVAALVASPAQAATPAAAPAPAAGKAALAAAATASKAPKVSISTPKASTGDYEGSCPVNVTVSSKIKVAVDGKTTLAYRWLHGDGSKGKIKTVKLKGHGAKYVKVSEKLKFEENVKGWEAVQVLGPRKAISKKGYFSVSCQKPIVIEEEQGPEVEARVWASPSRYVGTCATSSDKVDFTGVIRVSDPAWVRYRWVLNGRVVDYGRTKVYDSKRVGFGISPRESQRGYAQLEILGPDRTSSNRAYYKVLCEDEAPATRVSATDLVTATNNNNCKVGAHATVSSTGRARVEYTWLVDGKAVDSGYEYFSAAGSRTVTLAERGDASKGGKITLMVSGAGSHDSITQSYAACQAPKPTVSVSAVSQTGQRNDMCADKRGPGVDFKATLTSTGPTTVKYYWLVNGQKDGGDLTREVNGSLDVTWGIGGTHSATETKGNIELVVVSPNSATSGNAAFSAVCPKPVAG